MALVLALYIGRSNMVDLSIHVSNPLATIQGLQLEICEQQSEACSWRSMGNNPRAAGPLPQMTPFGFGIPTSSSSYPVDRPLALPWKTSFPPRQGEAKSAIRGQQSEGYSWRSVGSNPRAAVGDLWTDLPKKREKEKKDGYNICSEMKKRAKEEK
ncbi:hypothetical protein IEQ34_006019 [Dendrobium chrysotoxum]|uniref:Uncharacterized protein n=1 Tax=Dendrobium chrysotoxum TaxID=161865 RepID=A0AAV7HA64_DENCH|nr:hypothetical protein IEQ34_006019 [Dendrobium chrysotoxum]